MNNQQPGPKDGLTFIHDGQELRTAPVEHWDSVDYGQLIEDAQRPGEKTPNSERVQSLAEHHPDRPKIKLLLDFAPHVTAEDFSHFPEDLTNADICLLEGGGQDALERAEAYQSIADRDAELDPPDLLDNYIRANHYEGTVDEVIIRALYGSHKVVGCVDLTEKDLPLGQEIARASVVKPDYNKGNYLPVRDDVADKWLRYGQLQRQREEINEGQFEAEVGRLLTKHPELADKDELSVLWPMGLFHSDSLLSSAGDDEGLEVSRRVPKGGAAVGYRTELARYGASGSGEAPEDLKDRAYLETVIRPWVAATVKAGAGEDSALISPPDQEAYLRDIVSRFSNMDIRMIFQADKMGQFNLNRLNLELAKKGLWPAPTTPEELRERAQKIREKAAT